jgi:hypothetical protein
MELNEGGLVGDDFLGSSRRVAASSSRKPQLGQILESLGISVEQESQMMRSVIGRAF